MLKCPLFFIYYLTYTADPI